MTLASFLAARTRRVRIGTAVTVLPLVHPLRIAEEVATVDQLSQGRFDFGIGRSGAASTYDVLGIPYGESQARFEEALAIIREAWKGEPFSYQGRFHRITNTVGDAAALPAAAPAAADGGQLAGDLPWVGRAGLPLFVGVRDLDIPELRAHLASYRAAWREAGHPGAGDVCLRLPVYAAPTEQAALEEPRENIMYFFQRHTELTRARLGRAGAGPTDADRRRASTIWRRSRTSGSSRRGWRSGRRRASSRDWAACARISVWTASSRS